MLRQELLKKISKSAGIPESENANFFEVFAHKAHDLLGTREVLKVPNIGFFKFDTEDEIKLLFSSDKEFKESDTLDFYLTNEIAKPYAVESAFSLSSNNQLLPVGVETGEDFFYPPFGDELLTLIQNKSDDFLNTLEVIDLEHLAQDSTLAADIEEDEEVIEDKFDSVETETLEEIPAEEKDEDIIEEIEDKETESNIQEFEVINTADIPEETDVEEIDIEDKLSEPETIEEDKEEEIVDRPPEEESKADEDLNIQDLNEIKEDVEEDKYEVIGKQVEKEQPEETTETENISEVPEGYELVEPNIPDLFANDYKSLLEAKLFDDYKDSDDPIYVDENGFSEVKFRRVLDEENKGAKYSKTKLKKTGKRRSKAPIFILALIIMLIGAFFVYETILKIPHKQVAVKSPSGSKFVPSHPKVINRNYDIPVNYPYTKGEASVIFEPIDASVLSGNTEIKAAQTPPQSVQGKNTEKHETESPKVSAAPKTAPNTSSNMSIEDWENAKAIPADTYKQVDNYIYTDGKVYFIQVSSWKVLSRALEQKRKLEDKGYKIEIEKLASPRGYDYYIDRIGSFNSQKEAEDYLKSH